MYKISISSQYIFVIDVIMPLCCQHSNQVVIYGRRRLNDCKELAAGNEKGGCYVWIEDKWRAKSFISQRRKKEKKGVF